MSYKYRKFDTIDFLSYNSNINWDHGNAILYNIVRENFSHTKKEQVLTKVLFIGRIYAAALERRKETNGWSNTEFYTERIWPQFQKMDLDPKINALKARQLSSNETISQALLLHGHMMHHLHKLTKLQKRSFVSKYLHFHLPHIFFLFDSRAATGIKKFVPPAGTLFKEVLCKGIDQEYAKYFCRCVNLLRRIKTETGFSFSPRKVDNLLIYA